MSHRRLGQTRLATASEHGILAAREPGHTLRRVPAPADLADLVERFWLLSWDLPAGRRTLPLAAWWGEAAAARFAADLAAAGDLAALVAVATAHLRAHRPAPDPTVDLVGRIVRFLLHDRSVTRVSDVAARFGLSTRSLQRLFHRYVGVSPKWVLRRYRLHEAAARITEAAGDWARVANELGYFDQSHFIREFTRAVGRPPAAYARALGTVAVA